MGKLGYLAIRRGLDYSPGAALWNHEPTKEVFAQLRANSVVVPSPEVDRLARAAKTQKVVVVIGIKEREDLGPGNGTLYNSLLTIDADGSIANHRRKLIPTYTERMVWGQGDGANLKAVDTSVGAGADRDHDRDGGRPLAIYPIFASFDCTAPTEVALPNLSLTACQTI